jgi:hypothetical protein
MKLENLLYEQKKSKFEEFSEKRLSGASKIVKSAKEKGGPAMLTYHHFVVKLSYYEDAANGDFDLEKTKKEFKQNLKKLCKLTEDVEMNQIDFQKLVGLLEVQGELIIKNKEK